MPTNRLSSSRAEMLKRSIQNSTQKRAKNVVMASHGRAPWYTPDGKTIDAFVIGIAGGSSSGKTSVARAICAALNNIPTVLILSQDAFYRYHTPEEIALAFNNDLDVDHPDSIDMPLFAKCLDDLKHGKATEIPVYSFVHHQRMPEKKYLYGASVIIVEGIMALQAPEMRDLYDLKVFVNCDSDLMLARRIKRDTVERGRDVNGILDQYLRFVKSSYDNFVQPSSKYADVIVPGSNNETAIELLVTHVQRQLAARTLRFRDVLAHDSDEELNEERIGDLDEAMVASDESELGEAQGVTLLPQTNQLLGIMTILRDEATPRGDFIFYADRLSTIIVERALTLLPHKPKTVITPLGLEYEGVANCDSEIVGVSILRSGGPFSHGLRRVIRDVPIGSMLIQSDPHSGEPLLLNCKLPPSLRSQATSSCVQVFLLDSQMGTGAAALMAIRVLLDHGVLESNITFLTYLIARAAVRTVRRAFPRVRIVTAAIDAGLDEVHFTLPALSSALGDETEAAGDADFGSRLISVAKAEGATDDDALGAFELTSGSGSESVLPARREGRGGAGGAIGGRGGEGGKRKLAWVISPGMGHIGDRYYIS